MTLMTPDRRPVAILSAQLQPVRGRAGLRSNEWHGVLTWINPAEPGQPYDGRPVHLTNPLFVIADGGVDEVLDACQRATLPGYVPDLPVNSSKEEFKRLSPGEDGVVIAPDVLEAAKGTLLHQAVVLTDGRRGLVIEEHDALKGLVDVMLETGELAERVQVREVIREEATDADEESGTDSQESIDCGEESAISDRKKALADNGQPRRGRPKRTAG